MASKALRNTLATIAFVDGILRFLHTENEKKSRNTTPLKHIDKAQKYAGYVLKQWPGKISMRKDVPWIENKINQFNMVYSNEIRPTSFYTSLCLALVSDIRDKITNKNRLGLLNTLIERTFRLHVYFDRKINKQELYDEAAEAAVYWDSMFVG